LAETEGDQLRGKASRYRCRIPLSGFLAAAALLVSLSTADDIRARQVLDDLSTVLREVSETVLPGVVTIVSRTVISEDEENVPSSILLNSEYDPFGADEIWQYERPRTVLVMEEQSSGVIISGEGHIVTSYHAVSGAYEIEVYLENGEVVMGDLAGGDSETDIALILVPGHGYEPVPIGDSDLLEVGQFILSFGSPFSLVQTMSFGIVSYLGRCDLGFVDYEDYIQTDVMLNPGSSGGALVNLDGELVGINTAIASAEGGYHGIGFAVPVNQAMVIVDEILLSGDVTRGYLGLMVRQLTPGQMMGNPGLDSGIFVAVVLPGSAAESAGILRGDVLLSIDGITMETVHDFSFEVAGRSPGDGLDIGIARGDSLFDIRVVLGERPSEESLTSIEPFTGLDPGWALSDLEDGSVSVDRVGLTGAAADAGLESGDIILGVNHMPVSGVEGLYMSMIRSGSEALLTISRDGGILYVSIRY
jgi:S1-C subfamily serine protease